MAIQTYINEFLDPKGAGDATQWTAFYGFVGGGSSDPVDNSFKFATGGPSSKAPSYLHYDITWFGAPGTTDRDYFAGFSRDSAQDATSYYAVQPGRSYAVGFSGRTNTPLAVFGINLSFYTAVPGSISGNPYISTEYLEFTVTYLDAWQDLLEHVTIPSGTAVMSVNWNVTLKSGLPYPSTNTYLDATAFYIVQDADSEDPYVGGFFDGDTPGAGGVLYAWNGAPNASTSVASYIVSLPVSKVTNLPLTLEVYRNSDLAGRPVEILNGRINPVYLEEMKGPGGGSFDILVDDPKIVSDPTLLDYRNVIKVLRGNDDIGAFVIQNTSEVYIDSSNEDAGKVISVSGEGLRTWFHDAAIFPLNGLSLLSAGDRVFSWASEKGSWYVNSDWHTPTNVIQATTYDSGNLWSTYYPDAYPAAHEFPDPAAWWIWDRPEDSWTNTPPKGLCYFRYEWDVSVTTNFTMYAAADDSMDIYVDGQSVVSGWDSYNSFSSTDLTLDAGHHIVAVRINNSGGNIGGLIFAMRSRGTPSAPVGETTTFKTGDAGWVVNGYPAREPGWTSGEVILKLLSEAKARGVLFANLVTPTFTDLVDSEGAPWNDAQAWQFTVGDDYQTVIDKLEELSCDFWIDPTDYKLYAVKQRGTDRTVDTSFVTGVAFRAGRNVVSASEDVTGAVKNALLINTADGWIYKESSDPSTSVYGKVEGTIQTNGGLDLANQVATYAFEEFSTPSTSSSYVVIPSDDVIPWQSIFVGDYVMAPKRGNQSLAKRRVFSLSCGEDSAGNITYTVEFDTIPKERIDRLQKMIENITAGTSTELLGALNNVTGGWGGNKTYYPNASPSSGGGGGSTTPPAAPTNLLGYSNGYWHQSLAYSRAHFSWNAVTLDTSGSAITVDHYDVWAQKNRSLSARTVTNLVTNPSFEAGTTGVVVSNSTAALSTAWAQSGTQSLKITPAVASLESFVSLDGGDGGLRSGLTVGNTYTVSAYIHLTAVQAGTTSALARTLSVVYKDSGGVYHWESTAPAPNAVGAYRLALTVAIPSGATAAYIVLYNGTGSGAPVDVYWDAVQCVLGSTLPDYFDGGSTSDQEYAYAWTGAANSSSSTRIQTDAFEFLGSTTNTSMNVERLDPAPYSFVVHAITSGAFSASSAALNLTLNGPDLLLAPPDDPSLVSVNGTVTISWDGLLANAVPGQNFSYVYAGSATSASGTYSPIGGSLNGAGQFAITNLSPGSVWYFKLYAVDKSGHVSASSNAVAISVAAYSGSGGAGAAALAVPVGAIVPYAGASLPSGYALCDGAAVSRTTYSDLYAAIGVTYGAGDGSTTFNLPNLKGRVMVGTDSTQTEFTPLGKTGGEKTHVLTVTEMPSHTHQEQMSTSTASGPGSYVGGMTAPGFGSPTAAAQYTLGTGGDGAHNNLQPYLTVNFVIKTTIDSAVPIGTSIEGYWSSAPAGYLLEDGSAISRTTYATLFGIVGTTFGSGDGSTTFNLPDSRGRVLVSKNTGTFSTLGAKGGEETHTQTVNEMPSHSHSPGANTDKFLAHMTSLDGSQQGNLPAAISGNIYALRDIGNTGGGTAFNVLQPYIVVNRAIKY